MENFPWSEIGVGVAAVATLGFVVHSFLKYLGNHISGHTKSLENLVRVTSEMHVDLKEFVARQQVQSEALWILAKELRSK